MSEWINPGRRIAWLLINIIPNHCPTTKVLCPRKSPEVNILPLVWHWCVASLGASRIYSIQIALGHSYVPAKQCQHKNEGSHWFFVFFQKYIGYTITPTWTIYMYMYMCMYMYMYMYEVYIYSDNIYRLYCKNGPVLQDICKYTSTMEHIWHICIYTVQFSVGL